MSYLTKSIGEVVKQSIGFESKVYSYSRGMNFIRFST